jgi:RNA polymerase sigma factor (sigma-70 family)
MAAAETVRGVAPGRRASGSETREPRDGTLSYVQTPGGGLVAESGGGRGGAAATDPRTAAMAAAPTPGDALAELCARLQPQFGRILSAHRIPPQDGEDLIQTTLLLALGKWREIRCADAWMRGTLRTHCLMYWHERRRHLRRHEPLEEREVEPAIASAQERRDLLADLETLSRSLPHRHRAALALRYHAGHELLEVAAATGLTFASVKTTLSRAVAQLRRMAAQRGGAASPPWPRGERAGGAGGP